MLSRKKRRKQERQEKKARKYDRYKKLKGLATTEQFREERKRPVASPVKRKRRLASKKQTQIEALVEDKGIEKEKRELKKLEKLLSIKERKEEKQKKLPNAFIRDGLDYVLDFARYTNSESDNDISSIEGEVEEEELPSEEEDYQSSMEEETEEIEKEDISLGESSEGDRDVQKKKKVTFAPDTFATQKPSTSSSIPASSSSPNVNKRIQGLMNKLNESNIQTMFTTMEELYRKNSQREVTKCFCEVFLKSVIQPILIKDKFAMELVMLVTLLHQKIGSEV
ncbi:PREDICTED: nucleolar MIF4G domain-containing protein 1-like, partial [Amphimedon queenslandica]|uniref:MI domain-containing protein n=2 Tax=Amphimedon queenslandica TaxID=400682 RepID=A0AAN0K0Y9_AMPQE